jgi:hypothetical protein
MFGLNAQCPGVVNLYLRDLHSGDFRILREDCNDADALGSLNTTGTKVVYAVSSDRDNATRITVYDIATQTDTIVKTLYHDDSDSSAYFDCNDMIVFDDSDGRIMRMDGEGQNVSVVATPETPFQFQMFWMSPDRTKIVAVENERSGSYVTTNYQRLVLLDSDGSDRRVLLERHLGEWNFVSWRPDSTGLIFYYHTFNGQPWPLNVEYPEYMTFDLSQDPVVRTDLSGSDLGSVEENVCFYTRTGDLLSITTGQLYDPCTGSLLVDCSHSTRSVLAGDSIVGTDLTGGIYFADADGENFREFDECDCRQRGAGFFEGFESGGFSSPWKRYTSDAPWTVTDRQSNSGRYCAQAGAIDDGQTSRLKLTRDCGAGEVSFFVKVSSEPGFDIVEFRIDGALKDEWSGYVDWTRAAYPVTAGTHTFEWTYLKDSSASKGADTAWIDDITLPVPQ